jgi:hypothetical protein
MPYRYAHYFVGAVLAVIVAGFWASYFAPAGAIPIAFHVHAISAMMWLTLLIAQHMSIHRRANAFHKQMGKASFALFPCLILGFVLIIEISANRYVAHEGDFIRHNGPSFGIGMLVAIAAYLTLYFLALKHRRNIKLHAGYMLATPLILFESPFSRVMDSLLPWMNFIGSAPLHVVQDQIVISDGLAILFAMSLYAMDRKHGAPWLVASGFMALQAVVMWFAPAVPALGRSFAAYAAVPLPLMLAAGLAAALLATWAGWRAGAGPSTLAKGARASPA